VRALVVLALALVAYAPLALTPRAPTVAAAVAEQTPAPSVIEAPLPPEPRGRTVVVAVPTPVPAETPIAAAVAASAAIAPVIAAPVATPVVAAVSAAESCPATFFCYPRVGIAGPVIAYNDCSGATDVGTSIRQLTCVRSGIWLAGHAYTQFGRVAGFRVGDVVFVGGRRFEISGSAVHHACDVVTWPVAPLSLQTSLDANRCGQVLVVQGR
jgi:hypothetical protein